MKPEEKLRAIKRFIQINKCYFLDGIDEEIIEIIDRKD